MIMIVSPTKIFTFALADPEERIELRIPERANAKIITQTLAIAKPTGKTG
jgi:hypothetical protein